MYGIISLPSYLDPTFAPFFYHYLYVFTHLKVLQLLENINNIKNNLLGICYVLIQSSYVFGAVHHQFNQHLPIEIEYHD